ncbi:MAG: biopolymer transporter ExbD [Nitrospinota bacterium]|nr:biopolymer transporter ExbD [Nitrospinota bacterium]MDH5677476.1 biopolymer transporter ExbD [Nitrospinota bacterium]MDH5756869.1 biopolymer transporter ExbD [Nitrospinota bacterium]
MEFEGRRRSRHAMNLTPLIDLMFLLLVFFLLTADFINNERIALDLPDAESSEPTSNKEPLMVSIDKSGNVFHQGSPVEPEELEPFLRTSMARTGVKVVSLRGDKDATLSAVVQVLDASRRAGAESVDVITEKP